MTATIEQQIARLEALPAQDEDDTTAEFSRAIAALQDHNLLLLECQDLAESLACRNELLDEVTTKLNEATAGLETVLQQRDALVAERDALIKSFNAERLKAEATRLKLERITLGAQEELKALRALNPQRLAKQVKELQAKNKIQTDANALQREQITQLKKGAIDYKMVAQANIQLRHDNQLLDAALTEAGRDISNANRIQPLHELGDWGIYPDESDGKLIIVDKTTDAARPFTLATRVAKIRPVPAKVLHKCEEVLEELAQIRAHMTDYQEAV